MLLPTQTIARTPGTTASAAFDRWALGDSPLGSSCPAVSDKCSVTESLLGLQSYTLEPRWVRGSPLPKILLSPFLLWQRKVVILSLMVLIIFTSCGLLPVALDASFPDLSTFVTLFCSMFVTGPLWKLTEKHSVIASRGFLLCDLEFPPPPLRIQRPLIFKTWGNYLSEWNMNGLWFPEEGEECQTQEQRSYWLNLNQCSTRLSSSLSDYSALPLVL